MDNDRLKIKIGEHEFEAEGSSETVDRRLAEFKALVTMALSHPPTDKSAMMPESMAGVKSTPPQRDDEQLLRIMRVEDRIVSLTVRAQSADDAALLVLFGQKMFRNNDSVTGMEVIEGLTVSGQTVARVDRVLDRLAGNGLVIVIGQHRGRRYRLTNAGLNHARELASTLIAMVA